jgi:hypothetical protein
MVNPSGNRQAGQRDNDERPRRLGEPALGDFELVRGGERALTFKRYCLGSTCAARQLCRKYSLTVFLEVTLTNGQNYSVPVEDGHTLEEELDLFLKRQGRYGGDWVPLQKAGRDLFVRYEQIILVSPKTDA